MVTKKDVMKVLKGCYDPELPVNIVDLGLIYGVNVQKNNVHVKMTLTSLGCPAASMLRDQVLEKIKTLKGSKSAKVEIVWDPPWTPKRMSKSAKSRLGFG
jgi:metal-sulfur cluster biosynthetic enzyme